MAVSRRYWISPRNEQVKSYLSPPGIQGLVISIVFTSLAAFLVLARVYTRRKLIKRMEDNDWMIILSFVFMSFFIVEALNGMGMHLVDIPTPILLNQMKAFWLSIPFHNAALLCAKASILMQYVRVFPSRYDNVGAATWSAVECNVGIICACLPTLRPLIFAYNSTAPLLAKKPQIQIEIQVQGTISEPSAYAWTRIPGMGVSATITTHINDLEYGTCEWDADRYRLSALNGVRAGAAKPGACVGDHDGTCRENIARTAPNFGEKLERDRADKSEVDAIVVGTLVRTHSSSSSPSSPLAGGK
ncbi:hypothetical protein BDW72DRAFT_198908 [Aspergillus terricola var. indicus]